MRSFYGQDIVSIRDMDREDLEQIFAATERLMEMSPDSRLKIAKGKTLGYFFFEPSTRTRLSFQAAITSIGGTALGIADAVSSSIWKGESLADTVRIMSIYSDVLALRHPADGSSRFAAEVSDKPVINAGSGTEEHPTQAIQDIFTIRREKGRVDGLKIGVLGDLKYGKTCYSLLYGLENYNVKVSLISPESLRLRYDFAHEIRKKLPLTEYTDIEEVVDDLDVLYVTRVQRERFSDEEEYLKLKGSYVIGRDVVRRMKEDSIIMHPLPRVDEIPADVDRTRNARYFKQVEYGKYTRPALLGLVLNENGF